LLRRLGILGQDADYQAYLARRTQLLMLRAAQRELQRLSEDAALSSRVHQQLEAAYLVAVQRLEGELDEVYRKREEFIAEELRATREHLLRVEKNTLQDLQRRGLVDAETAQHLLKEVDGQLLSLASATKPEAMSDPTVTESEATPGHK